jgi:hypothetical protein
VFSLFRPVPEKRLDWSTGILQLVLGGAVGFALKRSPWVSYQVKALFARAIPTHDYHRNPPQRGLSTQRAFGAGQISFAMAPL